MFADVLLPHVHKLWAPLVHRFSDAEPLVTVQVCVKSYFL